MATYIDKDKLINNLKEDYAALVKERWFDDYVRGYSSAIDDIIAEPTADVQEVKHAKRVHCGEDVQCSNCGHVTDDYCIDGDMESGYYTVLPHYCGNCGARMFDEDENNEQN